MIKQGFMTLVAASLISIGVPMASAQDNSANRQAAPAQSMPQDNAANGPDGGRGHRGPMDPAQRTAELTKKLNLTSDQQAKVQSLLDAQRSQMESARQDNSSAQQDRHAKMMDIHKSTDTQIRAVLDSNQQKKWDDMQARREQREQEHRGGGPQGQGRGGDQPGPPPSPQQ
jgi:Spy/CpxP family protein refolding chaperone